MGSLKAENEATVTVTVKGDINTETVDANNSTVTVTGSEGGADLGSLKAENEATVTVTVKGDINTETVNANNSTVTVTGSEGGADLGSLKAENEATVTVTVKGDISTDTLTVTDSQVAITSHDGSATFDSITAKDDAAIEAKTVVTVSADKTVDANTLTAEASSVTVISDGTANITDLTASDSASVKIHTAGDITLDTVDVEDSVVIITSLSDGEGHVMPGETGITGGGKFTARYVEADRSRLEIDVWEDLRIFDQTDDQPSAGDQIKDVLVLRDMAGGNVVKGTTTQRGAFLTSRNGAVDSTHDDYEVYTDANANAYFRQEDQWYVLESDSEGRRFAKLDTAPDLTGFINRGKYSLYTGTTDSESSIYMPDYAGQLILERSGNFYRIVANGIEKEAHLSESFLDAQKLLNVGAGNYYDSWFTDKADLTVSAKGDIQVRDSLRLTNHTNATLTSSHGGIIIADYYMDTDGDGIGDLLQPSRYLVKNSVVTLTAGGGDVRQDRVFVETSFASIGDCTGDVNSKTWYVLGSKFPINLEGDVNIVCLDGDREDAIPAVQIIWSNEDFYIYLRMNGEDGEYYDYIQTGVDIVSRNGMVRIESMDGNKSASNTLDLYAVASTVNIQAAQDVQIPEMELNTPNDSIKLDDGETTATGHVYHELIFKQNEDGKTYTAMTAEQIPDPAEHAYGTVMNITSTDGGFNGNHIKLDGALNPVGDVYRQYGVSQLNIVTAKDIDLIYNLTDRTQDHIDQYGENIADRALTIRDGSKVMLKSTEGSVTVLDPAGDGTVADILLKGTETERGQLQLIADDTLSTGYIDAVNADIYLRTTGTEADDRNNDILVNRILGTDVNLEMDSAGNIDALDNGSSLLLKLEGETSLRLAAKLDIGNPEYFALIDVPCTVVVDQVTDLYADLNLRDADGNQIFPEIKEYAISQGYLVSDAEAMVQKLITISKDDYLGNSDLRFYNILLPQETLNRIRTELGLKSEDPLTADNLIQGFGKLDEDTRKQVLSALYDTAVSDGQGLEEIETDLRQQNTALENIQKQKENLLQKLSQTEKLTAAKLENLKAQYEDLLKQEESIRARIRELNDRKADIQDRYQDYTKQDSGVETLLNQAQGLLTKAEQLSSESSTFAEEAQKMMDDLDVLLKQLTDLSAFHEQSLETARNAAEAAQKAAQTAAQKAAEAEQLALAALEQSIGSDAEGRKEAAEKLQAMAALATAANDLADTAYTASATLNNTFVDIPARDSEVLIGQINGELYLNNEGDIRVVADNGRAVTSRFDTDLSHIQLKPNPILIGQILSQRGDVHVENVTDGILAKTLEEGMVNILADEITLKAKGSIGSAEQPLITEQRDVTPSKLAGVVEEIYQGQKTEETVSGAALPGKGVIGIQQAQRFEELTGETEIVAVTLLMADGTQLATNMALQDLRELTKQANTTDEKVYNFLTDATGASAALQVVVRYDWVRYLDPEAGTRTDAESQNGSIYLAEQTGKLHIGQIKAAGDIQLSAPDGVYSVLTEEEIASGKQNILASGENSQVTVEAGTGGIGTSEDPLRVQISGDNAKLTTDSDDGVYLRGTGDLNLEFTDPTRHVEIELIEADIPGGIANLTVNDKTVGGSDVLTGYTKSLGSLELHTDADVGTTEAPFLIVTDAAKGGTLILSGNNVNILQEQGDLLAENVVAQGNLQADIGGSIIDASDSELTELLRQYREQLADTNAQQNVLDELKAEWNAIMNNDMDAKRKQELADARENVAKEQSEYDEADQEQQKAQEALKQAQEDLAKAKKSGDKAAIAAAEEVVASAKEELQKAEESLNQAKSELDQALDRLQKAEAIEDKFENLQNKKDDLEAAYESGNPDRINEALAAYEAAKKDTAPYTDYVKRAESDQEIAEKILKDAFGENFREALEASAKDVRDLYQPLLNMLDTAHAALDKANARLDELNGDENTAGSIAQAQKDLDEKKQALQQLIEDIRKAEQQGSDPAIQVEGDANIQAAGSISGSTQNPDDYVSIQVGGKLNTETDGDTKLVSPGDMHIGEAETNDHRLDIIALGNVKVDTTDADGFSGAGDNIDVNLEGDAILGDIIADSENGNVVINSSGSLTQEPNTSIRGEELDIQAKGDVNVNVYVDHVEIAADGNVDLSSGKTELAVDRIEAGGDVNVEGNGDLISGGGDGITSGGNVTIHMGGNVGTLEEKLPIYTDGDVVWDSEYGLGFIRIIRSPEPGQEIQPTDSGFRLWDDPQNREYYVADADSILEKHLRPGTGLEVFGQNLKGAFLWVGTEQVRQMLFADAQNLIRIRIAVGTEVLFDYGVAIDRICKMILDDGKQVPVIERDENGRFAGQKLTFRFFVGSEYNGLRYTVAIERDGTITETSGIVTDGYVIFRAANEPSSIQVLIENKP
ncbi:MAG: hypothetical protein IKY96_06135 [Oscillospiraceae bacterium]|nr:hypothetical protein [Oscillospiraceae bacterium]